MSGSSSPFAFLATCNAKPLSNCTCEVFDLAGAQRQSLVRHRASDRRRTLDDVQAIHLAVLILSSPFRREVACIPHAARQGKQEIRVKRENHFSFVEMVLGINILAECQASASQDRITSDWLIVMPTCRRKLSEQGLELMSQRRRGDCFA